MMQAVATSVPHSISEKLPWPFFILQYADDTLIFSTAKGRAAPLLHLTLKVFSAVSGLQTNPSKSSFVPFNLTDSETDSISRIFSFSKVALPISYLGLPLSNTKPPREWFQAFISRVGARLAGWKGKLLSRAGRVLLTGSVLSTMPIYAMSVLKFPLWVIKELDKIRKKFIWSSRDSSKKGVHLLAWQRVCLPKEVGGLGLHDLRIHNTTMLLRWWWLLHCKKDSLWTLIATRLFAKRTCLAPPLLWNQNGSFFWKELHTLRYLFQISTFRVIGNGRQVSFWYDNWGGRPLRFLLPLQDHPPKPFISYSRGMQEVQALIPRPRTLDDSIILEGASPSLNSGGCEGLKWRWLKNGEFSVGSLYKAIMLAGKVKSSLKMLWKMRVPPTVRLFLYLLASDRLLTQHQLLKRGFEIHPNCALCGCNIIETSEHLFFKCPFTENFWAALSHENGLHPPVFSATIRDSIADLCTRDFANHTSGVFLATGFWLLWLERNNRIFRSSGRRGVDLVELVRSYVDDFVISC